MLIYLLLREWVKFGLEVTKKFQDIEFKSLPILLVAIVLHYGLFIIPWLIIYLPLLGLNLIRMKLYGLSFQEIFAYLAEGVREGKSMTAEEVLQEMEEDSD